MLSAAYSGRVSWALVREARTTSTSAAKDPPSRRRSSGLFFLGILPDPHRPTTTDPTLHLSRSVLKPHGARPLPVVFDLRRHLLLVAFEETNASLASKLAPAPLLLPSARVRGACLGCCREKQQPSKVPAPALFSSLVVLSPNLPSPNATMANRWSPTVTKPPWEFPASRRLLCATPPRS
ncbi:uncharacterized protein LOC125554837 [Triticum urartu]|uniref:uncharacterized protein LOC125554837 n=1 Tax=Triticum urartu TaxID=4572 RepID=UPI002043B5C5|nr:uncharacterized protein LOC125554837 [Triticum urartu]